MTPSRHARSLGISTLLLLAATPAAWAQNDGWYGGFNAGRTAATIDDARITSGLRASGFGTSSIQDDDRSRGFKVFGGYQLNRNVAIEGGYFDLGKFGYTANTIPAGSLTGDIRLKGLNLDLVGKLPLTERFSALGRIGLNYAEARDTFRGTGAVAVRNAQASKRDTNLKLGLGLEYAMTDNLSLRGEIERYRVNDAIGNRGHVDMASVGLVYYFGPKAQPPVVYTAMPAPVMVTQAAPAPVAPPPPPPPPRMEKYTLSATELFGFDSARLAPAQPKLDEVAAALLANTAVAEVVITGYTDRIGSDRYNQALSERRANAVRTYLTGKGVAADRLKAQGRGESNPVVTCTDKKLPALIQCLEPNRRVEIEQISLERRTP